MTVYIYITFLIVNKGAINKYIYAWLLEFLDANKYY